jgi:hypothetical protein
MRIDGKIKVKKAAQFPKGQGAKLEEEYKPELDSEDKVLLDSRAVESSDSGSAELLTEAQPDSINNDRDLKVEPLSKKTVARKSGYLKDILGG